MLREKKTKLCNRKNFGRGLLKKYPTALTKKADKVSTQSD